jgi:hypothetical protein
MTNQYGLDSNYFKRKLTTVAAGLAFYKPDELARELYRLAITSCEAAVVEEIAFKRDNGYIRAEHSRVGTPIE